MNKKKLESQDLELAPLRSLDEFLLGSARFQIPNIRDLEKWNHRVISNMMYYQTNYFLMSIAIFLIVGFVHPVKMLMGILTMVVALVLFTFSHNFKKQHPIASVIAILVGGCFVTYTLGSLLVFLMGILLPFAVTFIHASLRLRNMKNKIVNQFEVVGMTRTPMRLLLEQLGIETQLFA